MENAVSEKAGRGSTVIWKRINLMMEMEWSAEQVVSHVKAARERELRRADASDGERKCGEERKPGIADPTDRVTRQRCTVQEVERLQRWVVQRDSMVLRQI
jgi:hypothetical protein